MWMHEMTTGIWYFFRRATLHLRRAESLNLCSGSNHYSVYTLVDSQYYSAIFHRVPRITSHSSLLEADRRI